jgi:hypothetical protein
MRSSSNLQKHLRKKGSLRRIPAFSLLHSHFFALYALSRFTFVVLLATVLYKLEEFLRIATAVAGATYNTNYSCKYILYLSKSDTIHVANDSAI